MLREAKDGEEEAPSDDLYSFLAHTVPALVAELRAAREVIEAARRIRGVFTEDGPLAKAVNAYDEAVASPLTTPTRRP